MLYTRNGDKGTSGLFGSPDRLPKDHAIFEALGSVDELNSLLGVCYASIAQQKTSIPMADMLRAVQEKLFIVQAELAGAQKAIEQGHVDELEGAIAQIEAKIENPHSFVIAGATTSSALFDYARSVSRRAERRVIAAKEAHTLSEPTYKYLNRLSSLLYTLARFAAQQAQAPEASPSY